MVKVLCYRQFVKTAVAQWLSAVLQTVFGDSGSTVVKVLCYRQFLETAVAQWLRCCATDILWRPR